MKLAVLEYLEMACRTDREDLETSRLLRYRTAFASLQVALCTHTTEELLRTNGDNNS